MEKIHAKRTGYEHELVRIDGNLLEDFVHGANIHTDLLGQPLVGLALTPQFFTDEVAYAVVRFHLEMFTLFYGAQK